jgi:hypothetical protein
MYEDLVLPGFTPCKGEAIQGDRLYLLHPNSTPLYLVGGPLRVSEAIRLGREINPATLLCLIGWMEPNCPLSNTSIHEYIEGQYLLFYILQIEGEHRYFKQVLERIRIYESLRRADVSLEAMALVNLILTNVD